MSNEEKQQRKIAIYEAALKGICEDLEHLEYLGEMMAADPYDGYEKALLAEQALSLADGIEKDSPEGKHEH